MQQAFDHFRSSGGVGSPNDALILIRKQLGQSFRDAETEWRSKVRKQCEHLKTAHPKSENESEEEYISRLEPLALDKKPGLRKEIESKVRLAGFVIGHPQNKIVKEDIAPKIDYWHHRSGEHADFIFLGFSRRSDDPFDAKGFTQIVHLFEEYFDWKYSGQTDLIILNVRYNSHVREAILDVSEAVVIVLEDAIEDKAIRSVGSLIEDLIRVTRKSSGNDPSWSFSDRQGAKVAGSALKNLFLSLLPESVRGDARKGFHFYVKDLRKRK